MEKQLLKKILNHEFFVSHQDLVLRDFFPEELGDIFDVVCTAHEKYASDLKVEWVRKLYDEYNPAATVATKRSIAILLDDIAHEDDVPDELARDLLKSMHKKEYFRQIAEKAVDAINGREVSFSDIRHILEGIDEAEIAATSYNEVEFDLDGFLSETSTEGMFPFRLPPLQHYVYGAGRGNFIIEFARPESGKTSYAAYETAGYLRQGLKVAYFGNEEPVFRVYLRVISSLLEKDVRWIRENTAQAKEDFLPFKENLRMIDCVGMDITDVDAWVARNNPDVVILDQLDGFSIRGSFSRGDEMLDSLYRYGREIAKRNNCLVWALSQCSADGEGLAKIDPSMLAGSKTGKFAAADLIIGIGKNAQLTDQDEARQFNIGKNKINGWHGEFSVMLDRYKCVYYE